MDSFNVPIRTGAIALSPVQLSSGPLGWCIAGGQLLKLLHGHHVTPFVHAAPIWVVEEATQLKYGKYSGVVLAPGAYTVDAVAEGLAPTRLAAQVRAKALLTIRDVPNHVRAQVSTGEIDARATAWHTDNIGRVRYDIGRLFGFLYRIPFNWIPQEVDEACRVLLSTVCSSYASRSTAELFGYDDVPSISSFWTNPSDLGVTNELETLTHELCLRNS